MASTYHSAFVALAWALALHAAPLAWAQFRPVLIEKATLLFPDGRESPDSAVGWRDGKITEVGPKAAGSFLTKKIDGTGKFITSGLIDPWCPQAAGASGASGSAAGRSADRYDPYDRDFLRMQWRHGVLAAYVPARAESGAGGLGAVVKFAPGADESPFLNEAVAVSFVIGAHDESPLQRVQQVQAMRQAFREAREHRDAKEDYDADLKEYEEKLGQAAKKRASEPQSKPSSASRDSSASKPEPKKRKKPTAVPSRPARRDADKPGPDGKTADGKPAEGKAAGDQPKKPTEPPRDPAKDVLIRVLDGELPIRVWVERPEDIGGVLDVVRDYNVRTILEGASGAAALLGPLKSQDVTVILRPSRSSMQFDAGSRRFETPHTAARLADAEIKVFLGSGSDGSVDLALAAAQAVGSGWDAATAWKRLTGDAAELLGLEKQLGRLREGDSADFVVWSAHPLSGAAHVESVYLAGQEVYSAK